MISLPKALLKQTTKRCFATLHCSKPDSSTFLSLTSRASSPVLGLLSSACLSILSLDLLPPRAIILPHLIFIYSERHPRDPPQAAARKKNGHGRALTNLPLSPPPRICPTIWWCCLHVQHYDPVVPRNLFYQSKVMVVLSCIQQPDDKFKLNLSSSPPSHCHSGVLSPRTSWPTTI